MCRHKVADISHKAATLIRAFARLGCKHKKTCSLPLQMTTCLLLLASPCLRDCALGLAWDANAWMETESEGGQTQKQPDRWSKAGACGSAVTVQYDNPTANVAEHAPQAEKGGLDCPRKDPEQQRESCAEFLVSRKANSKVSRVSSQEELSVVIMNAEPPGEKRKWPPERVDSGHR